MNLLKRIAVLAVAALSLLAVHAQSRDSITTVYVIFKTHLDVGFTDLSSKVEQNYLNEFIPKALDVAERLRADRSGERYVWTTGAWLVWEYLHQAPPADVKRLERAIRRGDIVWNGVPYPVESEAMNRALFEGGLALSARLDKRYHRHTVAAKMTDVPGHTRSIIAPLARGGIRFLHVGVNPACTVPGVPPSSAAGATPRATKSSSPTSRTTAPCASGAPQPSSSTWANPVASTTPPTTPTRAGGIHFNLSNNLWGTNFSMWNEGSLTYRFTIEWLPGK